MQSSRISTSGILDQKFKIKDKSARKRTLKEIEHAHEAWRINTHQKNKKQKNKKESKERKENRHHDMRGLGKRHCLELVRTRGIGLLKTIKKGKRSKKKNKKKEKEKE
jgi:hypothetical protein